jgi:glycosyltransferase involved in cell wall biosynthesis
MVKHSKEDYELVIKSQTPLNPNCKDSRVKIEIGNPASREDMYDGFDAMILPRRYAGLCLPMNEALMSALPVFMTNVSPNNKILPEDWLVESTKIGSFRTKSMVDIYDISPDKFANIVDGYIKNNNKKEFKEKALSIGLENFSIDKLKQKYLEIINK